MNGPLDEETARAVAWQSRTVFERLGVHEPGTAPADCEAAAEFLSSWRDRYEDAGPDAFPERLAATDHDGTAVRECVCRDAWPASEPLPGWLDDLDALLAVVEGFEADAAGWTDDYPFGAVVAPWVEYAVGRLPEDPPVVAEAGDMLVEWLVERLLRVAAEALFVEFRTVVAMREPSLVFGDPPADPGSDRYRAFVDRLLTAEGLASLLEDYPVLARLVVTTTRQWVEAVTEFGERLDADRDRLAAAFGSGDPGDLAGVEALTGDRHADGRTAFRVAFEDGPTLAYKPRSVEPERGFGDLLDRVSDRVDGPTPTAPAVLSRDGYGWTAWADHEDLASEAALERYYRRAGVLAAVAHVAGLTDLQFENLVAAGDQPVVVDAETILQPPATGAPTGDPVVSAALRESALHSRLFPWTTEGGPDGDLSGLCGEGVEALHPVHSLARWDHPNADAMTLREDATRTETARNRPVLDGEERSAADHVDAVTAGFEAGYRALAADGDALLADDGPLARLAGSETRFLYATTDDYYSVVRATTSPDQLADGTRLTEHYERLLAGKFDGGPPAERWWRLYRRERAALKRLDVPRLTARPDSRTVSHDGEAIGPLLDRPGLAEARQRARDLDPAADLPRQVDEIRLSLGAGPDLATPTPVEDELGDGGVPADETFLDRARGLFEDVVAAAREDEDGHPTWLLRADYDDGSPLTLRTTGDGLYSGRTGVALFFAALAAVDGDARYRRWSLDALAPVRQRLDDGRPFPGGIGATEDGVGSATYALRTAGRLLGEDELVADALRAADRLDEATIRADDQFDVVGGTAGAALSLLALYEDAGDAAVRDLAVACGDHLLDERVAVDGGAAWPTGDGGDPLTGFSHGAAGVAYALARLADATGADRFADAAVEAVEYEQSTYDADRGNWPDFRAGGGFMDAWCHGRTGVGLARLATARHLDADAVAADRERALEHRETATLGSLDNLCCGNAGRAAFAATAGRTLDDSRYAGEARALVAATTSRADRRGRLSLQSHTGEVLDPTLFQGVAGVGYAALRVAYPSVVPCLLCWE